MMLPSSGHIHEQMDVRRNSMLNLPVIGNKKAECMLMTHSAFSKNTAVITLQVRLEQPSALRLSSQHISA
jgi:hypothetical protein